MKNIPEKTVGYGLLILGIAIILFAGFNVYQVFTSQAKPVQIFNFSGISFDASSLIGGDLSPQERELVRQQVGDSATLELLPADVLNQTSNLIAHLFFMGCIASIGFRIGNLGTLMARPINVNLKQASQTQS